MCSFHAISHFFHRGLLWLEALMLRGDQYLTGVSWGTGGAAAATRHYMQAQPQRDILDHLHQTRGLASPVVHMQHTSAFISSIPTHGLLHNDQNDQGNFVASHTIVFQLYSNLCYRYTKRQAFHSEDLIWDMYVPHRVCRSSKKSFSGWKPCLSTFLYSHAYTPFSMHACPKQGCPSSFLHARVVLLTLT